MTHESGEAAELVRRIIAGDQQAKEELVGRYYRGVTLFVRRRVRQSSAAEDIVQETFRVALDGLGRLREPEKLNEFILGIGRNLTLEYFREAKRERNADENVGEAPDVAAHPRQYEQLLRKEEASIARRVLRELKMERDRQVLTRHIINEEDKERICEDLRMESSQFDKVYHRARERFKKLYKQALGGEKSGGRREEK